MLGQTLTNAPILSQSVVASFQQANVNLYHKLQTTAATQGDLQAAATSTKTLFGNMIEVGWNAKLQTYAQNNQNAIASSNLQTSTASLIQQLAKIGMNITSTESQQVFGFTTSQLQQEASQIATGGLATIQNNIISRLQTEASKAQYQPIQYRTTGSHPRLLNADYCADLGIAFGEVGIIAAFSGAEPIAIAFGVLGVVFDVFARMALC